MAKRYYKCSVEQLETRESPAGLFIQLPQIDQSTQLINIAEVANITRRLGISTGSKNDDIIGRKLTHVNNCIDADNGSLFSNSYTGIRNDSNRLTNHTSNINNSDAADSQLSSLEMFVIHQNKSVNAFGFNNLIVPYIGVTEKGSIVVTPYKNDTTALENNAKTTVGWYSNVNWDDDDNDGWTNQQAPPDAEYTGDKNDVFISSGDNDLRRFDITVNSNKTDGIVPGSVTITYGDRGKVWKTKTKTLDSQGASPSLVPSGTVIPCSEMALIGNSSRRITLYFEGNEESQSFKDTLLKATYAGTIPMDNNSDKVDVTVFGSIQQGFFDGPQQADNQKPGNWTRFPTYTGAVNCGIAGWNENGSLQSIDGIWNQMELQGTVFPLVSTVPNPDQYPVTWDMRRERFGIYWTKTGNAAWVEFKLKDPITMQDQANRQWVNDDFSGGRDKVLKPTYNSSNANQSNHIYFIDMPGQPGHTRPPVPYDYFQHYLNFRNWVTVAIYGEVVQASDFYKWHSKLYFKPEVSNGNAVIIRDTTKPQAIGEEWISLPANAI